MNTRTADDGIARHHAAQFRTIDRDPVETHAPRAAIAPAPSAVRPVALTATTIAAGLALAFVVLSEPANGSYAPLPDSAAAPTAALLTVVHAEGAQIFECSPDAQGALIWQLRDAAEPGRDVNDSAGIAAIFVEAADATATVATRSDVQRPALEAASQRDAGHPVVMIRPAHAVGGMHEGPCPGPGDLSRVTSSAGYASLRRAD